MAGSLHPGVEVRLLGAPEVLVAGAPLVVDTRKAVAIVVVLATDGRAYAREELAALLWPDSGDEAARGALRRTLSTLRAALPDGVLRIDRSRVELAMGQITVDLAELQRLGASDRAIDLVAAAGLARGPFLAGFTLRDSPDFDDWRAARSVAVERAVAGVLDRLADAHAEAGDLAAAADVVGRRIDLDPLDEGAHVRRMDLLAASGDRAAALRQYRACVAVLERELGVAPLPETTARYEAIRDAAPASASAMSPRGTRASAPSDQRFAAAPVHAFPMVGRDATLSTLEGVRRASAPDGHIVALTGEAGIGKTRLMEEAAEAARAAGATVLTARGYAAERSVAYGPIVGWLSAALADPVSAARLRALPTATTGELARLVPAIASPLGGAESTDAGAAQARLLVALVEGLTAAVDGPEPGLLILDDLAWADSATVAVVSTLVRRLTGRRVTVLLSWREEDLDAVASGFVDHVVQHPSATVIAVSRLGREDVQALVGAASAGGLTLRDDREASVQALWRASEGLPLYVVEALASGTWTGVDMPSGVRSVLRARLAPIGGVAHQVLAAAATIGRSFDLPTVRFASGRTEEETIEALEELIRRGIVREQPASTAAGVRYDFAHAGLRDVAEASTSLARRRLLHRRIAEALRLDVAGEGRVDPGRLARIARHERDAGRETEAATAFREAGDAARLVFANREAIAHYEDALALGFSAVAAVHLDVGDLLTRIGDYPGAIAAYEAAAAVAEPDGLAAVEAALARAHLRRGDLLAAGRHLDAAMEARPAPALRVRLLADRATVQRRAGDALGARTAADAAIAAATGTDDVAARAAAHRIAGFIALDRGAIDDARAAFRLALVASERGADPTALVVARTGMALTAAAARDLGAAMVHGEAAVQECRRIGDRHLEAAVENHLADILHAAGREDEALDHLRRAVAAFAEVDGDPADPDPGIWMLAAT